MGLTALNEREVVKVQIIGTHGSIKKFLETLRGASFYATSEFLPCKRGDKGKELLYGIFVVENSKKGEGEEPR